MRGLNAKKIRKQTETSVKRHFNGIMKDLNWRARLALAFRLVFNRPFSIKGGL